MPAKSSSTLIFSLSRCTVHATITGSVEAEAEKPAECGSSSGMRVVYVSASRCWSPPELTGPVAIRMFELMRLRAIRVAISSKR